MFFFAFSVGKKGGGKEKQAPEPHPSPDEDIPTGQELPPTPGLLQPDPALWEHINYIQTNIQGLDSVKHQVERLAM